MGIGPSMRFSERSLMNTEGARAEVRDVVNRHREREARRHGPTPGQFGAARRGGGVVGLG
ncbi:hypothetical protein STRIP9103_03822 [Streptomyces ipomoeae 91-03]|uniref:Uncharacterized protein n=1 Tax=Streptomyces ipomoeae 91-03 TaxID=698759 RepID=L1KYU7_9ACTN|nr:hypothetical protein STRIP9103_03822 [Streptomyces ipomoeae 91-03]